MRWIREVLVSSAAFKLVYCAAFEGLPMHTSQRDGTESERCSQQHQRCTRVEDKSNSCNILDGVTAICGIDAGTRLSAPPVLRPMHSQHCHLTDRAITLCRLLQIEIFLVPRDPLTPYFLEAEVRAASLVRN